MIPVALTIAGSDPSGGAGLQADLKTFHQFGVYGMSAVTLVTVQNTRRVSTVEPMAASLVGEQLEGCHRGHSSPGREDGCLGYRGNYPGRCRMRPKLVLPTGG